MTCQRFKKDMLMDSYGELNEKKRRRLKRHLSRCASCREEFEMTRKILASLESAPAESAPQADWEGSWNAIEAGLQPAGRRPRLPAVLPRWAYAPLALAVLFILGIAVGRYWWPWRQAAPVMAKTRVLSPAAARVMLSRYFEDVMPVLLDYAHNGTRSGKEGLLLSDREMARSLLVQNLLLKRALAQKNPTLADLLDDLGMILTEIANLQSRDTTTPASLKNVIHQRQVLTRIRRLETI
jgi:anti-sigma-K factor RskA